MSKIIKVALLGDSIRMNYGPETARLLGCGYEVWQPEDNCRFSKYLLQGIFVDWRENIAACGIAHFNAGNWDISDNVGDGPLSGKEEYAGNILRAARFLKTLVPVVCFATTTPVREEREITDNRLVAEYNEAVVPLLKKEGVLINDLYSVVNSDINRYIRGDDLTHLSDEGIKACAEKTAEFIRNIK
ncbi:MAG: SGNH/GDSL hydrolase family protein [Abditibacteriota bacterium]|nr:SGNH/GDSL hydrolase family protein [Abditibacteriota bacterium]